MATQIRDTQFGRLVRVFSRRKRFQYPDEIDPSTRKPEAQQESGSEEKETADPPQDSGIEGRSVEDSKYIDLEGWYGKDDPEVSRESRRRRREGFF